MAAAAEVSNMASKEQQPASPSTLRKRRRRVPTTGAAEDCHTCRKREVKCDRRRPYCSQCLEFGKDCSGYRTTLTWGVGVASRGKLRGMSLPIAKPQGQENNTPAAAASPPAQPLARPRANTLQTSAVAVEDDQRGPRKRARLNPLQTDVHSTFQMQSPPHQGAFLPTAYMAQNQYNGWQHPHQQHHSYHQQMSAFPGYQDHFQAPYPPRRTDLFPLHTTVDTSFTGLPWSPNSSSQSGASSAFPDGISPFTNFPRAPGPSPFGDPFVHHSNFTSPTTPASQMRNEHVFQSSPTTILPSSNQQTSSLRGSHYEQDTKRQQQQQPQPQPQVQSPVQIQPENTGNLKEEPQASSERPNLKRTRSAPEVPAPEKEETEEAEADNISQMDSGSNKLVPFQPQANLKPFQVPTRIRTLLEYYDMNICPVLVTFDNDRNPYRRHIMHLAMQNTGLQNALGALVTNNMRMRCLKEVPALGNGTHKGEITKAIGAPTQEEQGYKGKSIEFLNAQLADSSKAMDDSVLATLLILCLFHVCDSGFSKFKTQLAGVQKLLRMRSGLPRSDFHGWVEMFFAWFDVMTSAVNDRETQIQGQVLDLTDLSNDLGAVEEFSGCDGRLFKLIARLGRLNLLSQQRPVRELNQEPSPILTNISPDTDFAADIFNFAASPVDFSDDFQNFPSQEVSNLREPQPEQRPQFWLEWHNLYERLHSWTNTQFDGASLDSPDLTSGQRAMLHMSESFRWAALLYLERLAHPNVPSKNANLQDLVDKALYHIRAIGTNSCVTKFMLWPLFISGTECVDAEYRDLIRARCIEIQKESGFYNNISGLEVLERVWKENDEDPAQTIPNFNCAQQAFRWRSCMDRADGEYIVI